MLNDLDSKADKTQTKLDAVNDRMKDALSKINDKSSNFCASTRRPRVRASAAPARARPKRQHRPRTSPSSSLFPLLLHFALARARPAQVYIICIVMLLGLATVVYKMVSTKKT